MIYSIALFCVVLFQLRAFGQPANLKKSVWRKIDTVNNSGDENIRFITPGFKDRVWITYNASDEVSGTDGYEVENIPVTSSWRRRLYESRTGQLWTSNTKEILLYKNNTWESFKLSGSEFEKPILGILPTEYNKVLVLHSESLIESDVQSSEIVSLLESRNQKLGPFLDIRLAKDEGAWIIAQNGLARVIPPLRNLKRRFNPEIILLPPDSPYVLGRSFMEIEPGLVLVQGMLKQNSNAETTSGSNQLLSWNGEEWKLVMQDFSDWSQILDEKVREHILDEKFISPEILEPVKIDKNKSIRINDLALMPDGYFMIATDRGVYKECASQWRQYSAEKSLYIINNSSIETEGNLMSLTRKGVSSISSESRKSQSVVEWPKSKRNEISESKIAVCELAERNFIIQIDGQNFLFNAEQAKWMEDQPLRPEDDAKIVYSTVSNESDISLLQIVTDEQFSSYALWGMDSNKNHFFLSSIPNYVVGQSQLIDIARTDSNQIWIATSAGLYFFDNEQWEFFSFSADAIQASVSDISMLDRGLPIFATDKGILEFNGNSFSQVLRTDSPINSIIKTQNGVIWASSDEEVYCYIESTWVPFSFSELSKNLKINSISEGSRNGVWLSTDGGIFAYSPSADYDAPNTLILNKAQEFTPSRSGNISIEIDGIDKWRHTLSENIFFSYKLDDNDWSQFQKIKSLTLQNLSSGEHKIMVRSMDGNGNIDFSPEMWNFNLSIPWHYDSRVLTMVLITTISLLFLSWMAVDRHRNLQKSYRDVEKIVKERTRQLEKANEQLLMHKKMRAMGALASGVAHDFNSILSIVQGSANIIKINIGNPEKIEKRVDRIETVVKQGTTLVRAMLGFARDKKIQLSEVNVSEVINSTLEILNDKKPEHVTINLKIDESLPMVRGNVEYLQQILVNLLLNAFDALDNRGLILIEASTKNPSSESTSFKALKPDPDLEHIFLNITDYGAGIEPKNLERIFEPFFTTKALSTKKGTGLGLSMVYELAQQLGLGLSVGSIENDHTTFSLCAPVISITQSGGNSSPQKG